MIFSENDIAWLQVTHARHKELDRLKRENSVLRAQIALINFYRVYNAKVRIQQHGGEYTIITSPS
jgi:hypothetical protein